MNFGKNRVQYDILEWQYYRWPRFDTYFYDDGEQLAQFVCKVADEKIKEYENFFEFQLDQRIILQVFNNLSDFRQSNVGLVTDQEENNIGGTTKVNMNRAFLYFEGDYKRFEQQVSEVISEMIINQMLFGGSLTSKVAYSTLLSLPEWYTKGLSRYLSQGWSTDIDNFTRDAVLTGKYENFNRLEGEEAIRAGQSIWNYIGKRYGKNVIPNIIYITRISKSVESGFLFVLGTSFSYLTYNWLDYYKGFYSADETYKVKLENEIKKTNPNRVYQNLCISSDGEYLAYNTNEMGKYIIWVHNLKTGKKKSILRKEHRLLQITDYSYPLIAFHPSGQWLYYINENKGGMWLNQYDFETKKTNSVQIFGFNKINQFQFDDKGQSFVFTGVKDGQSDLFVYNLLSNTYKPLTNDLAEEKDAAFLEDGESIVFSSNRSTDSLTANVRQNNYDLFVYKQGNEKLMRLTETRNADESTPHSIDGLKFIYLTDESGVVNLNKAIYDSAISYIDTTVHYKYFAKNYSLTDYNRNIESYAISPDDSRLFTLNFFNKKHRLFESAFDVNKTVKDIRQTDWKSKQILIQNTDTVAQKEDPTVNEQVDEPAEVDTNAIDFRNYIFTITENTSKPLSETSDSSNTEKKINFRPYYYFTAFYPDNVVTQVDFTFLNQSYQTYTGTGVYYNPGFNILTKLAISDLFEDYRFTAAFRIGLDLNSTEYLFRIENLKKRLNKELIYYRQAFEESFMLPNLQTYYLKNYSNQLFYKLKYPFNQVSSISGTLNYRYDKIVIKSTDYASLVEPYYYKNWAGIKLEYVFDNSISLGENLYRGWRNKIFAEAYKQIDGDHPDLYVLGLDFRHYQYIHRNLIWASRLASSISLGESRLMYFLGSTDNWINFSNTTPTFDESVKQNREINWAFQSLATNMRGFPQNVRNGNAFAVLNNEIRWPVVRYFSRNPVTSQFLYNLQLITFLDVGTAWTGSSPYDEANTYNQDDYLTQPITIIIDNQKAPFVYGFGGGVRSKLLGYFIRADIAWGVDGDVILPRIFYLSLSLDF
ncbi:MAG: PD40 domain-containing protein [Bacteroidales bacterium]|nr:PD40 domain-containing protein [Bacteroidales bacterium]